MDNNLKKQMEQETLQPILNQYQMGVETLMLAYMAESGLGLDQITPVTVQEGNVIRTYVTKREG